MLKKLTIVLGMAVAVAGTTTVSSFVFAPEAHAFGLKSIKKAAKKVGRKVKKGGKAVVVRGAIGIAKVGEYEVRGAHKVGRGAKRAGKAIGRGAKKTGWSAKQGGKDAAGAAKRAGKHTGKAVRSYAKCIRKRDCGRIGPLPAGTKGNPRPAVHDHRS